MESILWLGVIYGGASIIALRVLFTLMVAHREACLRYWVERENAHRQKVAEFMEIQSKSGSKSGAPATNSTEPAPTA